MELTRPFAENGDRQDFPVDTQGDGTMSLQQGFGAFYGLPPEEGGLFIDRTKFNQLMYLVTKGVIDNKTAIEALESEYGSLVTSSPKLLTENLTWNIGSGGDYEDLQTAINEAKKYTPIENYNITINFLADYQINSDIKISNCNLYFLNIQNSSNFNFNGYNLIIENSIFFNLKCIIENLKINIINSFVNINSNFGFKNIKNFNCKYSNVIFNKDSFFYFTSFNNQSNSIINSYIELYDANITINGTASGMYSFIDFNHSYFIIKNNMNINNSTNLTYILTSSGGNLNIKNINTENNGSLYAVIGSGSTKAIINSINLTGANDVTSSFFNLTVCSFFNIQKKNLKTKPIANIPSGILSGDGSFINSI